MQGTSGLNIFAEPVRKALIALCKKYRVRNLALFGSSTDTTFDPARSDIDILVEFEAMPPSEHMQNFFGLSEEMEKLFDRPVDLVEAASIRNPYVRSSIQKSRVELYAAA
jgi:predicted nucleotidyltransferase